MKKIIRGITRLVSMTACAAAVLCLVAVDISAKNYYGQANDYLQYGVGARSLAMGSAFSALVDDASAPYYNPAGLAFLDDYQMMTMHAPFFMNTSLNYFSCVYPMGPMGSVSFSDVMMISDKFEERDQFNNLLSSNRKIMNNTAIVSYGVSVLKGVAVGANIKLLQEKVFGTSGTAMGADIGVVYQPLSMVSIGLLVANLNEPSITLDREANSYGRNVKFGVAFKALDEKLILTSDINKLKDEKSYFTFGLEANPMEYISVRTGLNQYSEITYGIGFNMNPISIDYAYSPHDLGNLSRISMNFYWGNIYRARVKPVRRPEDSSKSIRLSGLRNELKFETKVPDFVVKHWDLEIRNSRKEIVNRLEGDSRPPEKIIWDAKDLSDRPVQKGKYTYVFNVLYKNDKKWKEKGVFVLDLSTPQEGAVEIKINGQEYPQFNEPPAGRQLEEVPVQEIPVDPEETE